MSFITNALGLGGGGGGVPPPLTAAALPQPAPLPPAPTAPTLPTPAPPAPTLYPGSAPVGGQGIRPGGGTINITPSYLGAAALAGQKSTKTLLGA